MRAIKVYCIVVGVVTLATIACVCVLLVNKPPTLLEWANTWTQLEDTFQHSDTDTIATTTTHPPTRTVVVEPVILPCELVNGGLPLLMVRIPGSPPTKVVLDTASDFLLIADLKRCKHCYVKKYGGTASDPKQERASSRVTVHFGSQRDDVEFQLRDIQLGDFTAIEKVPVGVVKSRKSQNTSKGAHTFNILGIGGMGAIQTTTGKITGSHVSLIERLLDHYNQPHVFGFHFSQDRVSGLFVLGHAVRHTPPMLEIPMVVHPDKPYYLAIVDTVTLVPKPGSGFKQLVLDNSKVYMSDVDASNLHTDQQQQPTHHVFPEVLIDTGANFTAFPRFMERYFSKRGQVFAVHFTFRKKTGESCVLQINQQLLYSRTGQKLFYFAPDRCVIGTSVMTSYDYVEFDFSPPHAMLRLWR